MWWSLVTSRTKIDQELRIVRVECINWLKTVTKPISQDLPQLNFSYELI
jgi:hypothetical protein